MVNDAVGNLELQIQERIWNIHIWSLACETYPLSFRQPFSQNYLRQLV